jgi:hypothetical protein
MTFAQMLLGWLVVNVLLLAAFGLVASVVMAAVDMQTKRRRALLETDDAAWDGRWNAIATMASLEGKRLLQADRMRGKTYPLPKQKEAA